MSKPNKFRQVNKENMEAQPNGVENNTTSPEPTKIAPIVSDVSEGVDENKVSYPGSIGTFFSGCFGKITTFAKTSVSQTWNWCRTAAQWTWSGIKTIPSYCVIRWDTNDNNEIVETATPAKISDTVPPVVDDKSVFSFVSFIRSLCTSWLKFLPQRTQRANEEEQFDEEELAPSRWWGLGIKAVAVTAAVLVLVGGYFIITPFFNAPIDTTLADIEILEPTDQSELLAQGSQLTTPVAEPSVLAAPVVATASAPIIAPVHESAASQIVAAPREVSAPPQPEAFALTFPAAPAPTQGSLFDNDPFPSAPPASPSIPPVVESAPTPPLATLSALTPRTPIERTPVANAPIANAPPQLQPLVAMNTSTLPVTTGAPAPAPARAQSYVASNYNTQPQETNPLFNQTPTPPPVAVFPQTAAVERTFVEPEPTPEIVPLIQHVGTIQEVAEQPESLKPEQPEYRLNNSVNNVNNEHMMNSEPAPAIPRDALTANAPPVVVVPAATPVAELSPPQVLASETQPIDRQLWEQVELLRNATEAEPTQLRLDAQAAPVPALRFTPKNAEPINATLPAREENLLAQETANSLQDLLPKPEANANVVAISLPNLANAPQPVWATPAPAYRDDESSQTGSEGGLTFRSRIDSQISRSPSAAETYTIQPGDTYMTISDRFYGTSLLYTALAQHNQRLGIGWRPAEGVVIEIPTAEFLRMHYGDATNRQERRLETQRTAVRYIVQEGDTVFRLATDRLQDSTRWREIYAMNADRLQDVRDLQPGMEILLPVVETARRN